MFETTCGYSNGGYTRSKTSYFGNKICTYGSTSNASLNFRYVLSLLLPGPLRAHTVMSTSLRNALLLRFTSLLGSNTSIFICLKNVLISER